MIEAVELHLPCPDAETAQALARAAVEGRLAACANLMGGVTSVFRWQGAVETEAEVIAVFKTTRAQLPALVALLRDSHPYDLPAITWTGMEADAATLDWLAAETGDRDGVMV